MTYCKGLRTARLAVLCAGLQLACGAATGRAQQFQHDGSLEMLLKRRAAALQQQVASINRQTGLLEARIPALEQDIDRLMEEAQAIEVPVPSDETAEHEEAAPREVQFRPPLLREVQKKTPLALVCQNGRVAMLDFDKLAAEFQRVTSDRSRTQAFVDARGGTLDAGDFRVKVTLVVVGQNLFISQEVEEKSSTAGEPLSLALGAGSRLNSRMRSIAAADAVIQFAVYPDSFDDFRSLRAKIWDQGYDVNWFPMKYGETIRIGSGGGGVGVQ